MLSIWGMYLLCGASTSLELHLQLVDILIFFNLLQGVAGYPLHTAFNVQMPSLTHATTRAISWMATLILVSSRFLHVQRARLFLIKTKLSFLGRKALGGTRKAGWIWNARGGSTSCRSELQEFLGRAFVKQKLKSFCTQSHQSSGTVSPEKNDGKIHPRKAAVKHEWLIDTDINRFWCRILDVWGPLRICFCNFVCYCNTVDVGDRCLKSFEPSFWMIPRWTYRYVEPTTWPGWNWAWWASDWFSSMFLYCVSWVMKVHIIWAKMNN